jgi:hypothetical protein
VRLGTDSRLDAAFLLDAGSSQSIAVPLALVPGTYFWEVSAHDPGGAARTSARWQFQLQRDASARGVPPDRTPTLAAVPGPFVPRASLQVHVPRTGGVRVWIADARGRRRADLLDAELPAGDHVVTWDGEDDAQVSCASGVYFAVLETAWGTARTRLTLVR